MCVGTSTMGVGRVRATTEPTRHYFSCIQHLHFMQMLADTVTFVPRCTRWQHRVKLLHNSLILLFLDCSYVIRILRFSCPSALAYLFYLFLHLLLSFFLLCWCGCGGVWCYSVCFRGEVLLACLPSLLAHLQTVWQVPTMCNLINNYLLLKAEKNPSLLLNCWTDVQVPWFLIRAVFAVDFLS